MIDCTFAHLPGIRRKGEIRLWQTHIKNWKEMIAHSHTHPHFTKKTWSTSRKEIIKYQTALEQHDFLFLANHIPEELQWRMIPDLWGDILFLDVEMSGLNLDEDYITTIATFNGKTPKYFVKDQNLSDFPKYFQQFSAFCTFDGERADLPFILKEFKNKFNIESLLPPIHFDLFSLSRRLKLHGGLKEIETQFNLSRNNLIGLSGESAIILWKKYQKSGKINYLNTLIAYNLADVMFLPKLLQEFYNQLRIKAQLPSKPMTKTFEAFRLPIQPDLSVIQEISEK
ncbi:MAG: ribonuclease H-like domain-containing protein [Candidatus Lokiarchaeota archaeon]|nr:ribonuclease H-like domain-containing protein [Candidatus Harpocratesius repetitus]